MYFFWLIFLGRQMFYKIHNKCNTFLNKITDTNGSIQKFLFNFPEVGFFQNWIIYRCFTRKEKKTKKRTQLHLVKHKKETILFIGVDLRNEACLVLRNFYETQSKPSVSHCKMSHLYWILGHADDRK